MNEKLLKSNDGVESFSRDDEDKLKFFLLRDFRTIKQSSVICHLPHKWQSEHSRQWWIMSHFL